ncbi:MAGa7180 family putative nuclease [Metamycoplasma canadense]|uniref:YqaJ viral recombinase domain-containing protein n=1 Tax=Metamycoplasma canadense TaxID=29554 RepID=A0A077LBU0_9BACT|nr:hypothetical protein [Metamycoplasma canadense]BAP39594.1 hypothetical protein MCAN360_0455 [Metamycoplasma canadense]
MEEIKNIKIPTRKHYNGNQYNIDFQNKVVRLTEEYHKKLLLLKPGSIGGFRKITGSALGDILKLTPFNSEFAAFARLANFALPVLDKKYVNAGVVLEPKIIDKIEKKFNFNIKRFEAHQYNYDFFKDNTLFGGLPDGYLEDQKIIIEIKTAGIKKLESWNEGLINPAYIKQAQLYSYLMGVKKFTIVACFLEESDYYNLDNVDINKRVIKNWFFNVNEQQVMDDMKTCEEWYKKYTISGISPIWNDTLDQDLIKYLSCSNFEDWKNLYLEWVEIGKAIPEYE